MNIVERWRARRNARKLRSNKECDDIAIITYGQLLGESREGQTVRPSRHNGSNHNSDSVAGDSGGCSDSGGCD